jgi:hypothetical protein
LQVVPPTLFKDVNQTDITVIERSGKMTARVIEDGVEVELKPGPGSELVESTVGVIWSAAHVTMNKLAYCRGEEDERVLGHFSNTLSFCPLGQSMEYITDSDYMMEEWNSYMGWHGCMGEGLDRSKVAEPVPRSRD